ncbi:response regulator [Leptolyngbya sp. GB1-A1]|uniref:response regulator n=1 Tax=Leptolyngbya sp. GB1-A1 TaxID=2933908 RepID=UPI00329A51AE
MSRDVIPNPTLQRLQVLVVDDDVDTCTLLKFALETYGIQAHVASSARQALQTFVSLQPHLLISDIAMPNEDGYWLLRKLRALEAGKPSITPAIAVTAWHDEDQIQSSGFHRLVKKPFRLDELIGAIAELVMQYNLATLTPTLTQFTRASLVP